MVLPSVSSIKTPLSRSSSLIWSANLYFLSSLALFLSFIFANISFSDKVDLLFLNSIHSFFVVVSKPTKLHAEVKISLSFKSPFCDFSNSLCKLAMYPGVFKSSYSGVK